MREKLLSFLKLYEEEVGLLLWTAVLLFIIRSSGIILNNYAETAFLKRYGVEYMPIVNMLNAVATFFITGLLTAFLGKLPGAKLLSYIFIFSGIIVTFIRLLIPFGFDLLYPLLFMLKSQFELLQALLFWNMCNDLFNTRQSKRLFPLLTAGGVIGLILGSFGTPYFAKTFNLDNLLYLYLCTTLMGAVVVQAMGRNYPTLIFPEKTAKEKKDKPSMISEFKEVLPLIKDSILIKIVLVLTFMPNVIIPIMNYQFNYAINDQFASETAMIQFFGYFRGGLYMISLFILLFVGRIYGRWGLPVALMFHPFNYMIALFAFLFRFDMFSAMYARMSTNVIRTTINMPANSILIGLFPESYRNMIRPFLRGTVVRMALFLGSGLILISENYFHFHPRYLTLVALPFMLAWVAAPIVLKSKYAKILRDLIANNLLDIKSLEQKELGQIFKEGKILSDLEQSFLAARGKDAIWYAKLLKNFSTQALDKNIYKNLKNQDAKTKITLIKMLSPESLKAESKNLLPVLDPNEPEVTISILKIFSQQGFETIRDVDITPYINNSHPVVRGFAVACLYSQDPDQYGPKIDKWLRSQDIDKRQSGIVGAGLSGNRQLIDYLLSILSEHDIDPIIPDIIRALSRLRARELNSVIFSYLSYDRKDVKLATLDALDINDDFSLKKAILLLGDPSDTIHEFAKTKIKDSEYQNNKLVVESLGLPSSRIRRGLFELLETLDIREFDVLMFAKNSLNNSYAYLAMGENLKELPQGKFRDLAIEHILQKKELGLENIIRVLAIHDQTGKMKTAWRGIFSSDTRQRANAIELLSDIMDRKLMNAMLPLLESPSPSVALADGKKVAKIPQFDSDGKDVFSNLVTSEDWVDVLMGLSLAHDEPDLLEGNDLVNELENSLNENILKEVQMILKKDQGTSTDPQRIQSTQIPLGEKILLLKEIEIFSGLSAAELAAIASVTKELDYPEDRTVIKQNDVGETVFLMIDGQVDVIMEKSDGQKVIIDHISSGGSFGEMALIDNSPRSATICTTAPSRFLILHKQEFKETAMEYPRIALQICSVLSRTIRNLHSKVREK
ncbi:MAG: cyclic nucleotide-binding domain-containing protein [Desulfobacteraceae bacterium]|nr:cyclic nucleotide-binding domain-containing protein [Desulfobacteraceae bacterium]